jgi:2-hydroxychromene-2-carboxylate isomerase
MQFKEVKNKLPYGLLEARRFIKKHGIVKFTPNPHFPVNTVQIMRGAVAAEMDGQLAKYVEAAFVSMWERGKKMDDPEVIRAELDAAGLDGARTLARIQELDVKDKLLKNTEATVARGTFGTPTFYVGEEIYFGKDKLVDVEEEIVARKAA